MVKKLSSVEKIHHKIQLLGCLEGEIELHNEGMIDLFEDFSFSYRMERVNIRTK
jgi:hypothetical protein